MPIPITCCSKLVWLLFIIISLDAWAQDRPNKRSFHEYHDSHQFETFTVTASAPRHKPTAASSLMKLRSKTKTLPKFLSVLNRCLDQQLKLTFLGPFFVFAGIVGLIKGPLFAFKLFLFLIQFNIVFPTLVCYLNQVYNMIRMFKLSSTRCNLITELVPFSTC